MEEAKASWNTLYQSKEGFECQITLRGDDEKAVAQRAIKVMTSLSRAGAEPIKRFKSNSSSKKPEGTTRQNHNGKIYFDSEGVRRCNRKLKDGETCGQPVTEREGKYGYFWSCSNFKEHAS